MDRQEAINTLIETKETILELLDNAMLALREFDGAYDRAKAYWLAHIRCALDNDHDYVGGSMVTLQDTIDELEAGQ